MNGVRPRTVVLPLTLLVGVVGAVVVLAFLGLARHFDDLAASQSVAIARSAVSTRLTFLSRVARDFGNWGEAYAALHLGWDDDWANTNLGGSLRASLLIEAICVVDPQGAVRIARLTDGTPLSQPCDTLLGMAPLIDAARRPQPPRAAEPAPGIVDLGGRAHAAAVIALTPGGDRMVRPGQGAATLLVFLRRVAGPGVPITAGLELLPELSVDQHSQPGPGRFPLMTTDGHGVGSLVWRQERPGTALVQSGLPVVLLALSIVAVATWLILRGSERRTTSVLHAAALKLQSSEQRFRDFAGVASDWLWETDTAGRFTFVSERFAELAELPVPGLIGRTRFELKLHAAGGPEAWEDYSRKLAAREPIDDFRYPYVTQSGRHRHFKISGKPVWTPEGEFAGYRGTGADITTEVEAANRAEHLAYHDALTGLPNRLRFSDRLEGALASEPQGDGGPAVLCLDLDRFKEVNDTYGHSAGDRLLKSVAERLRAAVRPDDVVCRLSGDEFAILLQPVIDRRGVEALCRRLIQRIEAPIDVGGHVAYVGLSIGIAMAGPDDYDPATLLRHADQALYRSKAAGRGDYRFFEPSMDAELVERKLLEAELREALGRGELDVHYQPQLDLERQQIIGVEALARWHHPRLGDVPPERFIALAEQAGLIVPIGEFVLRRACTDAVRWPDLQVSVNISGAQFRHRGLVAMVEEILGATGLAPGRLELELTESVLVPDTEQARIVLDRLKAIGIGIVIDDFGTGHSSLRYLQQFPFDRIKIDQSFIHNLLSDSDSAAIVRAVIDLGRNLGMGITAEGVETADQLGFLRDQGCPTIQGFLVGEPMPGGEVAKALQRGLSEPAAAAVPRSLVRETGLAEAAADFRHDDRPVAATLPPPSLMIFGRPREFRLVLAFGRVELRGGTGLQRVA